jgi:hypothetical protein
MPRRGYHARNLVLKLASAKRKARKQSVVALAILASCALSCDGTPTTASPQRSIVGAWVDVFTDHRTSIYLVINAEKPSISGVACYTAFDATLLERVPITGNLTDLRFTMPSVNNATSYVGRFDSVTDQITGTAIFHSSFGVPPTTWTFRRLGGAAPAVCGA